MTVDLSRDGLMGEYIQGIGLMVKWMVKENWHGQMEDFMKGNIPMIKKMDLEYFNLQMVENMLANGRRDSNMERENFVKVSLPPKGFGGKAN